MIDEAQFHERFRLLSRNIEDNLRSMADHLQPIKSQVSSTAFGQLESHLSKARDAWGDFENWVLISTLEDLEIARQNCTPAIIDVTQKITRIKKRHNQIINLKSIKFDTKSVSPSIEITTYISYFDQLLGILIDNSIKYSVKDSIIYISTGRDHKKKSCRIEIRSCGPSIDKQELCHIGEKGFRSESAKKLNITGNGYGLYNAKRIINLLGGEISFSSSANSYKLNGVSFSDFTANIHVTDMSMDN